MRICPNCGYRNANRAETCLRCDYWLAEPAEESARWKAPEPAASVGSGPVAPLPFSRADTAIRVGRDLLFFILGVGLCPATLFAASLLNRPGSANGGIMSLLALGVLSLAVILLIPRQTRFIGYGLLAAAFIFPIVVAIACRIIVV